MGYTWNFGPGLPGEDVSGESLEADLGVSFHREGEQGLLSWL